MVGRYLVWSGHRMGRLLVVAFSLGILIFTGQAYGAHEYEDLTMGIIVGAADGLIGVQISPSTGEPGADGGVALGDVDGDGDLDAVVAGHILGGRAIIDDGGPGIIDDGDSGIGLGGVSGWETVITTQYGDISIKAKAETVGGRDTFTYEVANLSYERNGLGIASVAVPIGGASGSESAEPSRASSGSTDSTDDQHQSDDDDDDGEVDVMDMALEDLLNVEITTSKSDGWSGQASIGTLGGFLSSSSKDLGGGIDVGETITFFFSLPSPFVPEPPLGGPKVRYPPGLFLSGSAVLASGVIDIRRESDGDGSRPWSDPFGYWRLREMDWEDCDFVLHGLCIQGVALLDEGEVTFGFEVSTPDAYRGPLGGEAVVMPIQAGATVEPDPPVPPGWGFSAPDHTGGSPGFGVFFSPPRGLPAGKAVLLPFSFQTASERTDED